MAPLIQLSSDSLKVVEFTVHHKVKTLDFVRERLIAIGEIDDAKPTMAKTNSSIMADPLVLGIWTPMVQRLCCLFERFR